MTKGPNLVAAKWLQDANGNYIIDPTTMKPYIVDLSFDFGAFIDIGPIDGMIHISQTMDDYVTFSKSNVLAGKETKKNLKMKDNCRARIIAVSYKIPNDPKIGLTMRQVGLGNIKWVDEDIKKKKK